MTARTLLMGSLRVYQRWISPMLPAVCRFHPSCSEYTRQAVEVHGAWRGGLMGLGRLLRCQPFSRGGFDPIPEKPRCHRRHGVYTG